MAGKVWEESELQVIKDNCHRPIEEVYKLLSHRTAKAICHAYEKLNLNVIKKYPIPRIGDKMGLFECVSEPFLEEYHGQQKSFIWVECTGPHERVTQKLSLNAWNEGRTISCGCEKARKARLTCIKKNTTHNKSSRPLFKQFHGIKARCAYPSTIGWYNYGGRGIKLCDEWGGTSGFENFEKWALKSGWKRGLTIDRIDPNGNYCPENCRWATMKEQANNKRTNRLILAFEEEKTASQWLDDPRCKVNKSRFEIIYERIDRLKWHPERAITTPTRKLERVYL